MSWSWFERARDNDTNWMERLSQSKDRPTFEEIQSAAEEVRDISGGRLGIDTYDPYTGETYTNEFRVYETDDSTIIGGDGQIRIFVLPDLTAGHFDTQGGTDRMPDIVLGFDIQK
ncbi:hypothetical protein [Haloarchaeobius sp. FL176]|uniref:hypothetical protein n=1 Tax=Haloarchaeobius sp. FL176 TaxID=2967129 RepID=UPI0021482B5C|nr:hypothetical protein [Haloarchaeobius sp. FL176]